MSLLILTSSFACGMAFHNTASRYLYSLGREGVLPQVVAETHDHHKSPHKASAAAVGAGGGLGPALRFRPTASTIRRDRPGSASTRCLRCSARDCCWCCRPSSRWRSSCGSRKWRRQRADHRHRAVDLAGRRSWSSSTRWSPISRPSAAPTASPEASPMSALAILVVGLVWGFVLKSANPEGLREHRSHGERRLGHAIALESRGDGDSVRSVPVSFWSFKS